MRIGGLGVSPNPGGDNEGDTAAQLMSWMAGPTTWLLGASTTYWAQEQAGRKAAFRGKSAGCDDKGMGMDREGLDTGGNDGSKGPFILFY